MLTLIQAALCSAAAQNLPQTVKLRLLRDYLVITSVEINGQHSYDFLLDTGSSTSIIDQELARELHLSPVDRLQLVTLAGQEAVPRVYVESLRVGPKTEDQFELLVHPLSDLRKLDRRIRGVLGQNFLSRHNYLLDYRSKHIIFEGGDLPSRIGGNTVDFTYDEGKILVAVECVGGSSQPLRFTLDTGISSPVLFHNVKIAQIVHEKNWRVRDLIGNTTAEEVSIPKIKIGHRELADQRFIMLIGPNTNRSDDGLLPLNLFHAVYVDNRKQKVTLDPQMN